MVALTLTLIPLFFLLSASSVALPLLPSSPSHAFFDYFIFSQQWPAILCRSSSPCCSNISTSNGFTIHGIWPEYRRGGWPQCCKGPNFKENQISTLVDELQKYWPSLTCRSLKGCHGRTKLSFWGHEWEKHGTCAYPVIRNEYEYFAKGLQLHKEYDLLAVLEKAGFTPDSKKYYSASDIDDAVIKAFGVAPTLICSNGELEEVRLCFTKHFEARDCDVATQIHHTAVLDWPSNSCPEEILIPPITSSAVSYT